ncbi:MAG: GNAT family N-acyltransferase [Alphaproteobacteria bacterium]|nr:GNAT family N-acyltransferase [Alphaproteobacteria bacterium]
MFEPSLKVTEPYNLGSLRTGDLEVRLAENPKEIEAAQRLRYQVFYEEMQANASPLVARLKKDVDPFDAYCDHMLVFDHSLRENGVSPVVGTYRLLRQEIAEKQTGFYSSHEYDISVLKEYPGEILELGRSCVHADHRSRPTLQLLWRAIAAYVNYHRIEILFGCASFPGIDTKALEQHLSFLYHHHLAPPAMRTRALPDRYVSMQNVDYHNIDPRRLFLTLPPLIKGYLRVGAYIGDGAVVDNDFNTTDVCIIVKTELIADKYLRYYEFEKPSNHENTDRDCTES